MSNGDTCRFCGDPALEAKIAELEKIRDAAQVVSDIVIDRGGVEVGDACTYKLEKALEGNTE